jgi:hypothetical protein
LTVKKPHHERQGVYRLGVAGHRAVTDPEAGRMATEFALEDQIMVLDGRVLEIFHRDTEVSERYHVAYLRIIATPNGDGFKVRLGRAYRENDIMGGRRWKMTAEQFARFSTFVAEVTAARDNGPTP